MAELPVKELDVDALYQALEKDLGPDIATVIRDEEMTGEDFLDLTEGDLTILFSKMGQRKKIIRYLKAKKAPAAEVTK